MSSYRLTGLDTLAWRCVPRMGATVAHPIGGLKELGDVFLRGPFPEGTAKFLDEKRPIDVYRDMLAEESSGKTSA